jgi:hypothetical protein
MAEGAIRQVPDWMNRLAQSAGTMGREYRSEELVQPSTRSHVANQSLIHSLIDGCTRIRYHPKIWCIAIAIALPKPGKTDYSEPRAYHLIQLLDCIGKVLEKIMADRLTYFLNKHTLTPFSQFGAQKGSSTTDMALTFTHNIQTARNKGLVTSALTIDIKGYSNFINHKKLLTKMRQAHLLLLMIKWMKSFLSERQAAICLDGQCTKIKPVLHRLPQGSPISGPASSLYMADILTHMQNIATREHQSACSLENISPTTMVIYIDDGNIWVSSSSLGTNAQILQAAYKAISNQLAKSGLAIDTKKCKLIHFTRRKCDTGEKPSINIPNTQETNTTTIIPSPHIKWLGIMFDSKLNCHKHVCRTALKAETALRGLHMLGNTLRGLSTNHFKLLYTQTIRLIINYAAPTWAMGTKSQIKSLIKIQNKGAKTHMCSVPNLPNIHTRD